MHRLLRHLTLFWPLPNDCMLQLTGPQLSQGVAPSLGPQLSRPCRVAGKRAAPTPPELDEPVGDNAAGSAAGDNAAGSSADGNAAGSSASRTKQPRLSSWRRRKAKRAAAETGLAPSSDPAPAAPAASVARKRARTAAAGSEATTPAPSASSPASASSAPASSAPASSAPAPSSKAAKQLIRDIHATSGDVPQQGERRRQGKRRGPRPCGFAKRPVAVLLLAQLLRRHRRCSPWRGFGSR